MLKKESIDACQAQRTIVLSLKEVKIGSDTDGQAGEGIGTSVRR